MKQEKQQHAFPTETVEEYVPGMSLRDYFAAKAMQAMISNPNIVRPMNNEPEKMDDFCKVAYEYSDAMLKQREL